MELVKFFNKQNPRIMEGKVSETFGRLSTMTFLNRTSLFYRC